MLEGAFSFRGRIGRLNFFLNGLLMVPAAVAAALVLAFLVFPARRDGVGLAFFIACALLGLVVMIWFSLSLHVRRIRDIGWDPVVVIVGWIGLDIADAVAATLMPSWSVGAQHHGTYVGALVNTALSLSLLFWPGDDGTDDATPRPAPRMTRVEALGLTRPGAASASVISAPTTMRRSGFGRRGLG